ncbi:MAG: stage II sporulation protein M [Culicoidibacterales bacterium]
MIKYLEVKNIFKITVVFYFILFCAIILCAYNVDFSFWNSEKIQPKQVEFLAIFFNNITAFFKNLLFGIITVGLFSVGDFIVNILNVFTAVYLIVNGGSNYYYLIMYHGPIELFAIVLEFTFIIALVLKFLLYVKAILMKQIKIITAIFDIVKFSCIFIVLITLLYFIAAIVEASVGR